MFKNVNPWYYKLKIIRYILELKKTRHWFCYKTALYDPEDTHAVTPRSSLEVSLGAIQSFRNWKRPWDSKCSDWICNRGNKMRMKG